MEYPIDLHLGDCLEKMGEIKDNSIDLIICDLPYGQTQNKWDVVIPFKPLWEQYWRVLKPNGVVILFGQGYFTVELMSSCPKMWRYNLIWDKVLPSGFLNANKQPLRSHEDIVVFYKEKPTYNPQFKKGKPSHSKGSMKNHTNNNYGEFAQIETREDSDNKYPRSIWSYPKPHPSVAIHPTQKPIGLLQELILTFSNEGDIILDNCMGSGSTGVACLYTSRKFVGIELSEEYYSKAFDRIDDVIHNNWSMSHIDLHRSEEEIEGATLLDFLQGNRDDNE